MKQTPGRWIAQKYPDVKTWTVAASESVASRIASEADAHLIAAAPELLDAGLDILRSIYAKHDWTEAEALVFKQLGDAIAKAKGES